MSYKEAIEDGIRIYNGKGSSGITYYFIPCRRCGTEIKSRNYLRDIEYYCKDCRDLVKQEQREINAQGQIQIKEKRLRYAIERIIKQGQDISEYEKAIRTVKKNLPRYEWFESTEEIMVALELLKKKLRINHQVKIKPYILDFVIKDKFIVLEIDSKIYHQNKTEKERLRDQFIRNKLGVNWEVIRIDTEYINENLKQLIPAIDEIYKVRKLQRKSNNGNLLKNYSNAI